MPADRPLETATPFPPSTKGRTSAPPMRIALIALMISSDRFGEIAKLHGFERHFGFGGKLFLDHIGRASQAYTEDTWFTNNAFCWTGSMPFHSADRRKMLLHMYHLAAPANEFQLYQVL